ncbi:MAG: hypothetical protein M0P64_02745 [Candidatus Pacebacteria bacterium]|jgi:hypothetical protein|nr:hypothetical protein [Candidatus Paceibacterota bacterium]
MNNKKSQHFVSVLVLFLTRVGFVVLTPFLTATSVFLFGTDSVMVEEYSLTLPLMFEFFSLFVALPLLLILSFVRKPRFYVSTFLANIFAATPFIFGIALFGGFMKFPYVTQIFALKATLSPAIISFIFGVIINYHFKKKQNEVESK